MILKDNYKKDLSLFEITGFSMWPFLRSGLKLVIKRIPIQDLKIGDAVLYKRNNQLVCHRLVKKFKYRGRYLLYTRGDNSISLPELVTEERFLGKAIEILKNNKIISFTSKIQQIINRCIVIVGPLISLGVKVVKTLIIRRK